MKLLYIAGPFRAATPWGIEQNVRRAEAVASTLWGLGAAVICPHANVRFMGTVPEEKVLAGCLEIVRRVDALVLLPDWRASSGARAEKALAEELGKPIFHWGPGVTVQGLWKFLATE